MIGNALIRRYRVKSLEDKTDSRSTDAEVIALEAFLPAR